MAVNRALAELDFAPGELEPDQYEVNVIVAPDEGFLTVGGRDAEVEVTLLIDLDDYFGPPPDDSGEDIADLDDEAEGDDEEAYGPAAQPEPGSVGLRGFLEVVLGHIGVSATIHVVETADLLSAELSGDDIGVVIGKRGQTLDALEYLASIVLYPHPEARKRVELDAEGYKERRRRNLERVAMRKAQEAVHRGSPVELEPMTAAERKIVHVALKGRRDVTTESSGREPNRYVTITPVRS
jgi:spoIIIJ-associated protein